MWFIWFSLVEFGLVGEHTAMSLTTECVLLLQNVFLHTCIHAYMHTRMRVCIHAYMHTRMRE